MAALTRLRSRGFTVAAPLQSPSRCNLMRNGATIDGVNAGFHVASTRDCVA
jgi:hypothetical protein